MHVGTLQIHAINLCHIQIVGADVRIWSASQGDHAGLSTMHESQLFQNSKGYLVS
jgi:hypothetical protein